MSEPLTEAFKAAADIEANTPINIPGKIVDAATDIYVHHLEQQLSAVTAERDRATAAERDRCLEIVERTIIFREIDAVETNVKAWQKQVAGLIRNQLNKPESST